MSSSRDRRGFWKFVRLTAWRGARQPLLRLLQLLPWVALVAGWTQAQGVVRNVSSYGAFPNDKNDDTIAVKNAFSSLQSNDTLRFDLPGTYEIGGVAGMTANPRLPLLLLRSKANVTVTAVAGVRVLLTGYDRSQPSLVYPDVLRVEDCTNFVIQGAGPTSPLVFDTQGASAPVPGNDGLPFLQGRVVSVTTSTDGGACSARIRVTDPEMFMPSTILAQNWSAWMPDAGRPSWAQFGGTVQPVGSAAGGVQLFDLTFTPQNYDQPFFHWALNRDLVVTLNQTDTYCITLWGCHGMVVARDLLAHHLPGKWFSAGNIDALLVDNVDAQPPSTTRQISVNRDGVNASGRQMLVRNCDITSCGDDAIVSNGTTDGSVVPGSYDASNSTFQIAPPGSISEWPTGADRMDLIVLLDGNTLSWSTMEFATVTNFVYSPGPGPRIATCAFDPATATAGFKTKLWAASATQPYYTYNPSYSMQGATVTDCTVSGALGIGVVVRSILTTVSQCSIANTAAVGIHAGGGICDAYPWWNAGAPPHGLVVQSCALYRCGVPESPNATRGAIEIAMSQSGAYNPGLMPGGTWDPCQYYINPVYSQATDVIQNVSILDTVIDDFDRAGIFAANVGGVNGLQVHGCTFRKSGLLDVCHPEHGTAVTAYNCGPGLVQSNTYDNCQRKFWQNSGSAVVFLP